MPRVLTNGVQLHYQVDGSGGSPVLLIAGTGGGGGSWPRPLLDRLAERHRVVTYDNRATGETPDTDGDFSTRQFAADAAGLLTHLDMGPAHVLGHSMGGRVAQWLALDHPALLRSLVLAASGPGAFPGQFPDGEMPRGIPLPLAVALEQQGYERFFKTRIRDTFLTPEFIASSESVADEIVAGYFAHGPTVEGYLKHVIARQAHQTTDLLDQIAVPTLVLVGDADTFHGFAGSHWDQSMYLVDHIPEAELCVLEGLAHGFFWQAPERSIPPLLDWLSRHDT